MAILSYYRIYPTAGGNEYVWSTNVPTVSLTGGTITSSSTVVVMYINFSNTVNSITFAQSPYTALATCGTVICNTTGGIITVNLPDTATVPGEVFYFTNTGTNSVILTAFGTQTIDGLSSATIVSTGNRMLAIQCSGGNWTQALDGTEPDPELTLNSTSIETNKTLTDPTNIIRCTQLATTGADVVISAGAPPTVGQALIATSATTAAFGNLSSVPLSGISLNSVLYNGPSNLITGDATNFTWDYVNKLLGLGISIPKARIHIKAGLTQPVWSVNGIAFCADAGIYTDSSTAVNGTVAVSSVCSYLQSTLAATNTGVKVTDAASLYIAGPPLAGTNMTITNPWGIYVASGNSYYNGDVYLAGLPYGTVGTPAGDTRKFTSKSSELVLEQTGDQFGTTRLRIQNRNGVNGAMFEMAGQTGIDLVDFIFKTNLGIATSQNIRFEQRPGSNANIAQTTGSGNAGGEFQLGQFSGGGGADPNFCTGRVSTFLRMGLFGIGTANPASRLHVIGGNTSYTTSAGVITAMNPSNSGINGIQSRFEAATYNNPTTAANGTVTGITAINSILAPTLTATNTGVKYSEVATLYVGKPVDSTNVTSLSKSSVYAEGTISAEHIGGTTAIPTPTNITSSTGLGNITTALAISGTDMAGRITVTTSNAGAASAVMFTVTFVTAYATAPVIIINPITRNSANLTGTSLPLAACTTTTFTFTAGTAAIPGGQHGWYYHIIEAI